MGAANPKPSFAQLLAEADAPPKKSAPPKPEPSTDLIPDHKKASQLAREQFAWHILFGDQPFNLTAAWKAAFPDRAKIKTVGHQASKMFADPYVKACMARLVAEAKQRNELDEDFIIGHWMAMADANIFDYFTICEEGDKAGHLILKSASIGEMTRLEQQNVKKLKVRNTSSTITTKSGADITTDEQTIELELIDRAGAVKNLAVFLGMMKGKEGMDIEDLAQAIREGEERAIRRGRTFDQDAEDGEIIEN